MALLRSWTCRSRHARGGGSVPASARTLEVKDTCAAISDALGGVVLDNAATWHGPCGAWVSVYLGEDRDGTSDNPCLSVVVT